MLTSALLICDLLALSFSKESRATVMSCGRAPRFKREDGPEVHGQTLVGLDRHVANAAAFARTFAAHPIKPAGPCTPDYL